MINVFKKIPLWFRKKPKAKRVYKWKVRYLSIGEEVEYVKGGVGKIVRVYRDKQTDVPVSCDVLWQDKVVRESCVNLLGKNYSIALPVVDKGRKFNPVIRKLLISKQDEN